MVDYALAILDKLRSRGVLGAMWWCWADYAEEIAHLPPFDDAPHELTFGLVRSDGSFKPIADALSRFAATSPSVLPQAAPIAAEDAFYAGLPQSIYTLYEAFTS